MKFQGTVILKKGKEFSIQRYHPWIFSGAIQRIDGNVHDGCWVDVLQYNNKRIGSGHYQDGSIMVRMLTFGEDLPNEAFWETKITHALNLRKSVGLPSVSTNCFRLTHGEGDGIPGLVLDFYDGVVVMQGHSFGIHADRSLIATAIRNVLGSDIKAVYYKGLASLPGKISDKQPDEYLHGLGMVPHVITENNNKFFVDWEEGQKTGFFLDQRENRKLLGEYASGKKVLNTFCYTGGFSIYALSGNAQLVHSVDSSEKAIAFTRKNIELNQFDMNENACYSADTFDFLKDKKDVYDLIVLDPPAFAKHRDARHQAVKGYQRLNGEAMRNIRSGGIIFTFSCSQVVDRKLFYDTVVSSAIHAGRQIKVLHHLSQPADHPVSIFHPEGEYLKGLVLYVE